MSLALEIAAKPDSRIEPGPTLERDGFEVVDIPTKGPWLLPNGTLRVDLRPSTNIRENRLFLVYYPERADVWEGSILDPASKAIQDDFFEGAGYMQFQTQFPRHVVAARTKPQTPKPVA